MRSTIQQTIIYLYIALFTYTAGSKLIDFDKFQKVLKHSPLIGNYSRALAWGIPMVELALAVLLIIPAAKRAGLIGSLLLMLTFTAYLIWMLATSGKHLPCSCGGVIAAMSWGEHIAFNTGMIGLALCGLGLFPKK